jgi:hypothetical protein
VAGLPTRLKVADLLFANLGIDDADRPWFMLGALGPAIGEFIPNQSPSPPEAGQPARTAYYQIWQQLFQLAVGNPKVIVPNSDPTQPGTPLPGVVPTLATIKQMLATLSQLVSTRDFSGVQALQGSPQLTAFNEASAALGVILRYFQIPSTLQDIGKLLGSMSEPKIDWSMTPVVLPTTLWTGREWLHGKQTGEFAAHLFNSAGDDPRFVAYAKGWSATYALLMSSSGVSTPLPAAHTGLTGGAAAGWRTSSTPGFGATTTTRIPRLLTAIPSSLRCISRGCRCAPRACTNGSTRRLSAA